MIYNEILETRRGTTLDGKAKSGTTLGGKAKSGTTLDGKAKVEEKETKIATFLLTAS